MNKQTRCGVTITKSNCKGALMYGFRIACCDLNKGHEGLHQCDSGVSWFNRSKLPKTPMPEPKKAHITNGKLADAKRRALNILERWVDVTGIVRKDTGYWYELQGVVEDAVECGAQAACGVEEDLESEK